MPIDVSSEWLSLSQIAGGKMTLLARMYYGDESAYISLSSGKPSPALGTEKFLDVLSADPFPEVAQELDMLEHTHSIQNLQLVIDNLEFEPGKRWSDLVEDTGLGAGADIGFYNRKIEIRYHLPGITTFANGFPLLEVGIMRDIKHNRMSSIIPVEDRSELVYTKIGTSLVSSTDISVGSIPTANIGKTKPIVIGDHLFGMIEGSFRDAAAISHIHNMTPCVYLGLDASDNHRWQVSVHKMQSMNGFFIENTRLNRMLRLDSFTTEINDNADGLIIYHPGGVTYLFNDEFLADGTVTAASQSEAYGDFEDTAYAVNGDFTTFASITMNSDAANGNTLEIGFNWPDYEDQSVSSSNILAVRLMMFWYYTWAGDGGAGDPEDYFQIAVSLDGGATYDDDLFEDELVPEGSVNGNTQAIVSSITITDASDIGDQIKVRVKKIAAGDPGNDLHVYIYQMWKRVVYKPSGVTNLLASCEGLEYGTYINGRATGDGYTVTHDDDDAQASAELIPTQGDRDFSGANDWSNIDLSAYNETDDLTITADAIGQYCRNVPGAIPMTAGFCYHLELDVANIVGSWEIQDWTGAQTFGQITANGADQLIYFKVNAGIIGGIRLVALTATASADFDNFSLKRSDLIQNFAGAIEGVSRTFISLGNTTLDRDSFNVASTLIPATASQDYRCSTVIAAEIKFKDWLSDLLLSCRSHAWWQTDGTLKMKVIEDTYASSDRTIDARDAIELDFDRTPTREIKTAIDVFHSWDQNQYLLSTGISADTDQQSKYNISQAQSFLKFLSKHFADVTTAGKIRTFKKNFLKQPHIIAKAIYRREQLDLDIADRIQFTNLPYNPYGLDVTGNVNLNGQTAYKYWWIYKIARSDVMRFEAIQLHDLS